MTIACVFVVFIDYIILSYPCTFITFAHHMHKSCLCQYTVDLVLALWLSDQCVFISWTNLELIKFMFVSCGFAFGSLLCVCSFADVLTLLLRKRACD